MAILAYDDAMLREPRLLVPSAASYPLCRLRPAANTPPLSYFLHEPSTPNITLTGGAVRDRRMFTATASPSEITPAPTIGGADGYTIVVVTSRSRTIIGNEIFSVFGLAEATITFNLGNGFGSLADDPKARFNTAGTEYAWLDGVSYGTSTNPIPQDLENNKLYGFVLRSTDSTERSPRILRATSGTNLGSTALLAFINKQMPDAWCLEASRNPWALFEPA